MKTQAKKSEVQKPEAHRRPSWDEYFLNMVDIVGTRATCDRGRSGCVIVRDKRVISTGYVGSPPGSPHCDDVGHDMHTVVNDDGSESKHCIRTAHAEQNAMAQAARFGIALEGGTMYCKMVLCSTCAKMAITAGIKRIVCQKDYHASNKSKEMFKQAGVKLEIINKEIEEYKDQ